MLTLRSGDGSLPVVCRIAQLEERLTLDQEVLGSSPSPAASLGQTRPVRSPSWCPPPETRALCRCQTAMGHLAAVNPVRNEDSLSSPRTLSRRFAQRPWTHPPRVCRREQAGRSRFSGASSDARRETAVAHPRPSTRPGVGGERPSCLLGGAVVAMVEAAEHIPNTIRTPERILSAETANELLHLIG